MPIDSSVFFQAKPVQVENPMQSASQALMMRDALQRSQLNQIQTQQAQRQLQNQEAIRQAYARNMTTDAQGNPVVNQQGMMADIAKSAPELVPKMQMDQVKLANDTQKMHMQTALDRAHFIGNTISSVSDQPTYDAWKVTLQKQGIDTSTFPQAYSPEIKTKMEQGALDVKDRLTLAATQKGLDLKAQDLSLQRQKFNQEQENTAEDKLNTALNSSRVMTPDVKQSYTDRYNAQKGFDLIKSLSDPKKGLTIQGQNLLASEIGKIATGGVPQESELANLSMQSAQMIKAKASQYISNHPGYPEQQALVDQYKNYLGTIQDNANNVIQNSVKKTLDSYRHRLKPEIYQKYVDNYVNSNPFAAAKDVPNPDVPAPQQAPAQGSYQPPKLGSTYVHEGITYVATPQGWAPQTPGQQAAQ